MISNKKSEDTLQSPVQFLKAVLGPLPAEETLADYERWWECEGRALSMAQDRAGTPWLQMFDLLGKRIDAVQCAPGYWTMLRKGYREGLVWRAIKENSLITPFQLGYVCAFNDPGLYCPYTVSLATLLALSKYGDEATKSRYVPMLLREDESVWQGATWMTEAGSGSDLGGHVETVARLKGGRWLLTGEKYFTSNAIAELGVVAARPEGAPTGVRGLALFLTPKRRDDGELNFCIRRIKDKIATRSVFTGEIELRDSEAHLLGKPEWGIYLILEVLNCSRVANAMASVALAQRAIADAFSFARHRVAFGKPIIEHPLLRQQFEERKATLKTALALAWECVKVFNEIWRETPPYSEKFHLFRILVHLAKYWTAEFAVQTAKWCMEVHGGIGTLAEFGVERWLREAMILAVWEGPAHRQILDGLEAMERKGAHQLLFEHIASGAEPKELKEMRAHVEAHLVLPTEAKEAGAETLFQALAPFTARALFRKRSDVPRPRDSR
ncbi:MAG: acyl-CoA dehydrogenase family protein [Candidatus Hydrogenedentes bacterium]|nr:acyl-CoA dehydrogenase family protein [Candidatus Hydrogenedentota bacterium]